MTISIQRRNSYQAFYVLGLLLYGKHSSVTWLTETKCHIAVSKFARSLGIANHKIRRAMEWLQEHRYVRGYATRYGHIEVEVILPPKRRGVEEIE